MICNRCGSDNQQGARFCEECGNDLWDIKTTTVKSNKNLIMKIVVAIVVIAVVAGTIFFIGKIINDGGFGGGSGKSGSSSGEETNSSYEEVFDNFVKAIETGESKYYIRTMPKMHQELAKNNSDYKALIQMGFERRFSSIEEEFGEISEVSYEITDYEKFDKEQLKDYQEMLDDLIQQAEEEYDVTLSEGEITEGGVVYAEITVVGSESEDTLYDDGFMVFKINGSWCMYN